MLVQLWHNSFTLRGVVPFRKCSCETCLIVINNLTSTSLILMYESIFSVDGKWVHARQNTVDKAFSEHFADPTFQFYNCRLFKKLAIQAKAQNSEGSDGTLKFCINGVTNTKSRTVCDNLWQRARRESVSNFNFMFHLYFYAVITVRFSHCLFIHKFYILCILVGISRVSQKYPLNSVKCNNKVDYMENFQLDWP